MARGATILIGILGGAALLVLMFSPQVPRPKPAASTASPSPSASRQPADYGPPPYGVPLIYAADPANPMLITAFDWYGHPLGTIRLSAPFSTDLVPEPHCYVAEDPQTADEVLYTFLPGGPQKRVTVITNEGSINQAGVQAVGCSFGNDLAIAVRVAVAIPVDTWAVRLSDGKILGHWSYTYGEVENVVPSSDGRFVAENSRDATRIRSIPDGTVLATFAAHVYAFSDDDRLVLTGPTESPAPIRLVDWQLGREFARYQGEGWPLQVAVRPGSGDVAVAVGTEDQYHGLSRDATRSIAIIQSNGVEVDLPGRYIPLFPPYANAGYVGKGGLPSA
jgi:hypothetical protein